MAAFDLEKVLTTPQGETSTFYNKRKLSTYNFTIYDIGKKEGFCYMWNESDAKRGANEIATCLFMFLKQKKDDDIQEFFFYSDNCGWQNRNQMGSKWEKQELNYHKHMKTKSGKLSMEKDKERQRAEKKNVMSSKHKGTSGKVVCFCCGIAGHTKLVI